MAQLFKDLKLPLLLVLFLSVGASLTLPITPINETRYLSVAWEMWNGPSFLVPLLNGEPYSHKPPLLFWLIHAGWALFGVNELTPRLLPGLFSLLNLILTYQISLKLWPAERKTATCATLVLATTSLWDAWSVMIMFDMALTFWILLGIKGILQAAQRQRGGWTLLTIGITGGLLMKGPAVLVYLLSIPLFMAWWNVRRETPVRITWYLAILGIAAASFALALAWAIPAAIQGGEIYRNAIFWGQTANRITSSFAHRHPFWWYLPLVPLFFFPWILFKGSFAKIHLKTADTGTRFCLVWLILPLLIFSMISGKQIHYLIPFIPAGALLIGRNLACAKELGPRSVQGLGGLFLLIGLVAIILPLFHIQALEELLKHGNVLIASIGSLLAGILLCLPTHSTQAAMQRVAISVTVVFLFGILEARRSFLDQHNVKDVSLFLKRKMDEGASIATYEKYYGQYQFLGRLEKPITVLHQQPITPRDFAQSHSNALFISYQRDHETILPTDANLCFSQAYRGQNIILWQFDPVQP